MANKKFYWLKLKEDFFSQKEIKKLRRIAGGDTYVIIYLKMLLLTIKNDGIFVFEGFEENVCEELALELDEDVENVKVTFNFLLRYELIKELNQYEFSLIKSKEMLGSESSSAERVRRHRRNKALQCNDNVTKSNIEIEKDIEKDIELDTEREEKNITHSHTLTQEQYNYLIKNYPVDLVNRVVEKANKYKGCNNLSTIEKWIKEKIEEPQQIKIVNTSKTNNNRFNNFHQRDYSQDELDELEKRLLSKEV